VATRDRQGLAGSCFLLGSSPKRRRSKTDEEWRRLLTPGQYQVLRHEATEPAGSSQLLYEDHKGVFVCAGFEMSLFKLETKFDSGTGWPSFWSPIEGAVSTKTDPNLSYRGALTALWRASWPCSLKTDRRRPVCANA
jgi:SelR domain